MSKKKLIGVGIGVLVVAGILGASAMKKGTKAVDVKIEAVERRDLTASVTASGQEVWRGACMDRGCASP